MQINYIIFNQITLLFQSTSSQFGDIKITYYSPEIKSTYSSSAIDDIEDRIEIKHSTALIPNSAQSYKMRIDGESFFNPVAHIEAKQIGAKAASTTGTNNGLYKTDVSSIDKFTGDRTVSEVTRVENTISSRNPPPANHSQLARLNYSKASSSHVEDDNAFETSYESSIPISSNLVDKNEIVESLKKKVTFSPSTVSGVSVEVPNMTDERWLPSDNFPVVFTSEIDNSKLFIKTITSTSSSDSSTYITTTSLTDLKIGSPTHSSTSRDAIPDAVSPVASPALPTALPMSPVYPQAAPAYLSATNTPTYPYATPNYSQATSKYPIAATTNNPPTTTIYPPPTSTYPPVNTSSPPTNTTSPPATTTYTSAPPIADVSSPSNVNNHQQLRNKFARKRMQNY